jgi:hypothetical protein
MGERHVFLLDWMLNCSYSRVMPRTRANNGVGSGSKSGPVIVTQMPAFSDGATKVATKIVTKDATQVATKPTRTRKSRTIFSVGTPDAPAVPHPEAWRSALLIAGGDERRLAVASDGSVLIRNNPA